MQATANRGSLAAPLRQIIHQADSQQPITDVRTLSEVVEADTASRRVQLAVIGAFGCVAVLLAAIGIHGLLAYAVSSRTQEIGVRMALGARRVDIVKRTVGEAFRLSGAGILAGILVAYWMGRMLQSLLAGVEPWDLETLVGSIVVAMMMTLAGSVLPAVRAARIDPTVAMRG